MAFCPNCGAKLNDAAKFCTDCGRPAAVTPQPAQPPQQFYASSPVSPKKKTIAPLVIGGVAAIALAITLIATNVFGLLGRQQQQTLGRNAQPGSWAIYWYLCGTDLETGNGCATKDLDEMMEVTLPKNVTVVIETGGTQEWQNDFVNPDKRERFVYAGDELRRVQSLPLASMGDPDTFADFLRWSNENYPAEKQAVFLWDHGGGSLIGMESDELHGGDLLTLPEFKQAIESVPASSGAYELVGFDACLMATVEIADILLGDANYLVASQEVEPGIGWDYTGLISALAKDTAMDGEKLGRAICDTFYAACDAYGIADEVTLSVTDLDRADALLKAYNAVGDEALLLAVNEQQAYLSKFGQSARDSQVYGMGKHEMVDLGDLVKNAGDLLPRNGKALLEALDACVVYQVKGAYRAAASGLACYYNFSGNPNSLELYRSLSANRPFTYYHEYAMLGELSKQALEYIKNLAQQAGEPEPEPESLPPTENLKRKLDNFPVRQGTNGHWKMDLGPELASNLAAVFVKLMYVSVDGFEEGFRILWGTNRDLISDYENGVFTEDFADTWGSIDGLNVYMEPIAMEEGYVLYAVPVLLNSEEYSLHVGYSYGLERKGTYKILGAWKAGGEQGGVASKFCRLLQPGDVLEALHYPMLQDEDGLWQIDEPPMPMGSITVTEDTSFYNRSVGDGYFALAFEMVDYAGNRYQSKQASFRVRNGRVERLPGGIVPAVTTKPPGTIKGYYISMSDPAGEEYTFYRVTVDSQEYIRMAESLGLNNGANGDSSGDGYILQIYSDNLNMENYAGMQQVYLAGEYFAAETIHHQRDIVFRATNIIEIW